MSDIAENLQDIIIYNSADGKASVKLYIQDGTVWMNQTQLSESFLPPPNKILASI